MPEIQIQELLDTINRDGLEKAQKQQEQILDSARKKADEIINNAHSEAEQIIAKAKAEIETFRAQSEVIIRQAEQNAVLELKGKLNVLLLDFFKKQAATSLNAELVANLVKELINPRPASDYILTLSNDFVAQARGVLASKLPGLEIQGSNSSSTYKLALKDGSAYYDFSPSELQEMLSPFLTEAINKVLSTK